MGADPVPCERRRLWTLGEPPDADGEFAASGMPIPVLWRCSDDPTANPYPIHAKSVHVTARRPLGPAARIGRHEGRTTVARSPSGSVTNCVTDSMAIAAHSVTRV